MLLFFLPPHSRSPPCRGFTPTLCKQYTALQAAGKSFELVFVSSDRDEKSFNEYSDEMNFPALPFAARDAKGALSKHFGVQGIPTLVFVNATTGETISKNARGGISSDSFIADFPYHPKPVSDISASLDGINENASLIVFMESAEPEAQVAASEALNAVAVREKALPEAQRSGVTLFFTSVNSANGMNDRIRMGTGCAGARKTAAPQMVLVDLSDEGAVYHPAGDANVAVTAESITAFLAAYKAKTLTSGKFGEY